MEKQYKQPPYHIQGVQITGGLYLPAWLWNMDPAGSLRELDPGIWKWNASEDSL